MNNSVKILIGAGVGASIGWFVGAVISEIIALKSFNDFEMNPELEEEKEEFNVLDRSEKNVTKKIKSQDYTKSFKSLQQLAEKYGQPSVVEENKNDVEEAEEVEYEIVEEDDTPKDIEIISLAEYANDPNGYEAVTLHCYDDDVVTDEKDNPISHPEQIIGEEAVVSFGMLSDDEDVVYIRNTPKRVLYELVRLNKNYASSPSRARRRDRIDKMGEEENDGEANNDPS